MKITWVSVRVMGSNDSPQSDDKMLPGEQLKMEKRKHIIQKYILGYL